jgi:uncharacterized membrane protein
MGSIIVVVIMVIIIIIIILTTTASFSTTTTTNYAPTPDTNRHHHHHHHHNHHLQAALPCPSQSTKATFGRGSDWGPGGHYHHHHIIITTIIIIIIIVIHQLTLSLAVNKGDLGEWLGLGPRRHPLVQRVQVGPVHHLLMRSVSSMGQLRSLDYHDDPGDDDGAHP